MHRQLICHQARRLSGRASSFLACLVVSICSASFFFMASSSCCSGLSFIEGAGLALGRDEDGRWDGRGRMG